jgi:long-chain acyl-CoA synthetase
VEVVVSAPDDEGSGEIRIRGPIVMKGYWQDPLATAEVLEDGWLTTGDRGRFDRHGRLHITGRSKLLIITPGGKNISPEEIELAVLRSPFVAECLVYGAPSRHGGGEEVAAKIHVHEEYLAEWTKSRGGPVDLHALVRREIDRTTLHLAHYKHVVHFDITSEPFAKTTSQKIKRHLHIGAGKHGQTRSRRVQDAG